MDPCELTIQRWLYTVAVCTAAAGAKLCLVAGLLGTPPAVPASSAISAPTVGPCNDAH